MTQAEFELHPQLHSDTVAIADLKLCRLLLANDSNYPWIIMVPRRVDIREAYQLEPADQQQLLCESNTMCQILENLFKPDKLNVAALGNMVPQLHLHHVARFKNDAAWPAPIWGAAKAKPYSRDKAQTIKLQLMQAIELEFKPL